MEKSLDALRKHPKFGPLIKKHGPPDLKRSNGTMKIFTAIVCAIISQQISTAAATSIRTRVWALFPKGGPTPELFLQHSDEILRAAGLSPMKIKYARDAAQKFMDGTIETRNFPKMTSLEITEHLVQIKGVGVWTAHMLLLFTLQRPDILPTGDLGIQKGFKALYNLRTLPSPEKMEKLATEWRSHASVASWYLWRVADEVKNRVQ